MSFKQTFFPLTATDFSDISTAERQTFESKILDKEKLSLYNGWLNKDDKYVTDSSGAVNDLFWKMENTSTIHIIMLAEWLGKIMEL